MSIITSSGLRVSKIWSKAGFATCILIENDGRNGFLFDCGRFDESTITASTVFISHGHIDHIGSCIAHARARGLSHSPATYYVPECCIQHLLDAKYAFERLDDHEIPMIIIPFPVGHSVIMNKKYRVFSFPTNHRVASQGYGVVHVKEELMEQYRGLTSQEIRNIKLSGTPVISVTETIEVVYTGDTIFESLLSPGLDFIFNCQILLIEMTYLDGDIDKALKWGHIHLDQFINSSHLFNNQQIIFLHISAKYHSYSRILTILSEKLPAAILGKCAAALQSFGSAEFVSPIHKDAIARQSSSEAGWGWAYSQQPSGRLGGRRLSSSSSGSGQQRRIGGGVTGNLQIRRRSAPIRRHPSISDESGGTDRQLPNT